MHKDLKKIVKDAEAQGFTWEPCSNNHIMFRDAAGATVALFASTPSDPRSWKNSMGALKRAGFKQDRDGQRKGKARKG